MPPFPLTLGDYRVTIRHPQSGHNIHRGHARKRFGHLVIKVAIFQLIAKQGLDTEHRGFGETALMIATGLFPLLFAVFLALANNRRAGMGSSVG